MTTPTSFGSLSTRWGSHGLTTPVSAASDAVLSALLGLPHGASSDAALRELQALQRNRPNQSLRSNFQNLSPASRETLAAGYQVDLSSLLSLSEERDPEMLHEGFLTLGRFAMAAHADSAAVLFGILGNHTGVSSSIRESATRELNALRGTGSFGDRFEVTARNFARQSTDPGMLLAMTAGGLLYSAGRGAVLSRLLSSRAGFMTRGLSRM